MSHLSFLYHGCLFLYVTQWHNELWHYWIHIKASYCPRNRWAKYGGSRHIDFRVYNCMYNYSIVIEYRRSRHIGFRVYNWMYNYSVVFEYRNCMNNYDGFCRLSWVGFTYLSQRSVLKPCIDMLNNLYNIWARSWDRVKVVICAQYRSRSACAFKHIIRRHS